MEHPCQRLRNRFIDGIRVSNKYSFNRIILTLIASVKGPFSVIYHEGRHSGRTYQTPVLATYVDEMIILPLSYGENVDWLRDVLALGGCEIIRKNERMRATKPEVLNSTDALAILPEKRPTFFERYKLEKFLRLQVIEEEHFQDPVEKSSLEPKGVP